MEFAHVNSGPYLTTYRLAQAYQAGSDWEFTFSDGCRIELWVDCKSFGLIEYLYVAVAIAADGSIPAIVAAEVAPTSHDLCLLGLFSNGAHRNLGEGADWRDRTEFTQAALGVLSAILAERKPGT